jgi:hypothetical protein
MDRWTIRFDCKIDRHEVGPLVGDRPGESTGLGMGEQDRRPDLLEQRDDGRGIDLLLLGEIGDRRKL